MNQTTADTLALLNTKDQILELKKQLMNLGNLESMSETQTGDDPFEGVVRKNLKAKNYIQDFQKNIQNFENQV